MGWGWVPGKFGDIAVGRFLHLEEGRLCFKTGGQGEKTRPSGLGAWREWSDAILAEAGGHQPGRCKPGQFRSWHVDDGWLSWTATGRLPWADGSC